MAEALDALRQARDTAERRLARLQTLSRLTRLLSASLGLPEVLGAIARAAAQLMDATVVAIWIADEATRSLELGPASMSLVWRQDGFDRRERTSAWFLYQKKR